MRKNTTILATLGNIPLSRFPLALAPMEDITDAPFRILCKESGADLLVTEFISSEGLIRDADKSRSKLFFEKAERPLGIQIFGQNEESMKQAAEMAARANPDFIDLNFGCPVRKVVVKGAGAALLKDPQKMVRMTREVARRVSLPVTVKTRLGWDSSDMPIVDLAEQLQDAGAAAIFIHARTAVQLYGGKADWTLIGKVTRNPRMQIPVFGNGDIVSGPVALEMKDKYGVDGLMIGRAAIGNPWIFREIRTFLETGRQMPPPSLQERIAMLKRHLEKSILYKGETRTILEFRKFYSGYLKGIPDIRQIRMKLVTATAIPEILEILDKI